jgi:HEAT repeat protein
MTKELQKFANISLNELEKRVEPDKNEKSDRIMKAKEINEINIFLQQAQREAETHNWLEVNYYLQQLQIVVADLSVEAIALITQQQILELALNVLVNGDFQQKWNVAKVFPQIGTYSIPSLIAILENETIDTETKWFTVRTLGNFKEQRVVIGLATLLQSTSELELIAIASESLAKIGIPAIETLINLLQKTEYRLFAAKALAHIRLAPVLPPLLNLATDENPEIRLLAIEALGSFHEAQIPPVLIRALKDTHSMVRKEAVIALGFCTNLCQELNLVSHLQPLLYDLNPDVCRQAAISLGKMDRESAIKALNKALNSPHITPSLKVDLVKALAWSENILALDYLQAAIKTENNSLSYEIIVVLGRIDTLELKPRSIAILKDFWHSSPLAKSDVECKKALGMALGELRAKKEQDILEQLAQDENKMVQLYAIASLKKLG